MHSPMAPQEEQLRSGPFRTAIREDQTQPDTVEDSSESAGASPALMTVAEAETNAAAGSYLIRRRGITGKKSDPGRLERASAFLLLKGVGQSLQRPLPKIRNEVRKLSGYV